MHTYNYFGKTASKGLKLPPIYQVLEEQTPLDFAFKEASNEFGWLNEPNINIDEVKTDYVTKKLIKAHRNGRLKIFYELARTKAGLRSREFFRRYKNPSECIGSQAKRGPLCRRKEKLKRYRLDEWALRTSEKISIERQKIQTYLEQVIEADLVRLKKEELKRKREDDEKKRKEDQLKKNVDLRKKIQNLPNIEYMKRLKRKEQK